MLQKPEILTPEKSPFKKNDTKWYKAAYEEIPLIAT